MQCIELPMPPSLNRYYRHVGNMVKISAEGRAYREAVKSGVGEQRIEGYGQARLAMEIVFEPPDARRRDLDNLLKATLDSLQHAGVYEDDGQIDRLVVERGAKRAGGRLLVRLAELGVGSGSQSAGVGEETSDDAVAVGSGDGERLGGGEAVASGPVGADGVHPGRRRVRRAGSARRDGKLVKKNPAC